MLKLLKLEYFKFRNNNTIVLLTSLYFLLLPTVILIGKQISFPKPFPGNQIFFEFPTTWEWMAFAGSWLVFFFLGFISLFIVTSEISYKTLRQNIINGLTRTEYFLGKVYTIILVSFIATIYYAIVTTIVGIIHSDSFNISSMSSDFYIIFRYFLMCMGYMSFGLLIGFTIKKSSLATLVYMVYILFIEMILKWVVSFKISNSKWINYWPMNCIEDLTPNPAFKIAGFFTKKELNFDILLTPTEATIASTFYILLFLSISYFYFIKKDL